MKNRILTAVLAVLPALVSAQTVTGIRVEPASIKAGEQAKVTVEFDVSGAINCGMRVHFGDGQTMDFKVNQSKDVPLVVSHTYASAGNYTVKAEPKRNEMLLRCSGKNQETQLTVNGAAAAAASTSSCPEGWTVDKKSVNKKSGAFTCQAKAGTPVPAAKLACPGDLGYFENPKKGQLGCK